MSGSCWLLCTVALPVLGSLLIPLSGAAMPKKEHFFALALSAAALALSAGLLVSVARGEQPCWQLALPLGFDLRLEADYLSAFAGVVAAGMGLLCALYSCDSMSNPRGLGEYFALCSLFTGAMLGFAYSFNLAWLLFFWELAGFCAWRLGGYFRGEKEITGSGKAALLNWAGLACLALGLAAIHASSGTLDMRALRGEPMHLLPLLLIITGIFANMALLPFCGWLPDAASAAPASAAALLYGGVLLNAGAFAMARIFCAGAQFDPSCGVLVMFAAGLGTLAASGAALLETDIRRIVAYSAAAQSGFVIMGLASMNRSGVAGALLYILCGTLASGGLFLCAGLAGQKTGTRDITRMGGLFKEMPVTGTVFAMCAFSLAGFAPFGGFFCRLMSMRSAASFGHPVIMVLVLLGALLCPVYLLRVFYAVFLGSPRSGTAGAGREAPPLALSATAITGMAALLLGIFIYYPSHYAQALCQQIGVVLP